MSKKTVSIQITDSRDRRVSDLAKVVKSMETKGFEDEPASGTAAVGSPTAGAGTTQTGDNPITIECLPPPPATPITGGEGPDMFGEGQDVWERLQRDGDSFIPSQRCDFYRAVWFDGIEAYRPTHFIVSPTKAIVPIYTLPSSVIVSARYVIR